MKSIFKLVTILLKLNIVRQIGLVYLTHMIGVSELLILNRGDQCFCLF